MGSKDEDFSEFVGARWLTLVRAAMALGCTVSEAEDLAQTTLLRAYASWTKVATTLGIAPGTVKSRLSRALATLSHSPDLAEFGDPNESR